MCARELGVLTPIEATIETAAVTHRRSTIRRRRRIIAAGW
jgi:hypothetical protein